MRGVNLPVQKWGRNYTVGLIFKGSLSYLDKAPEIHVEPVISNKFCSWEIAWYRNVRHKLWQSEKVDKKIPAGECCLIT